MIRKLLVLSAVAAVALVLGVPSSASAQIVVNIGPAPVCPYGYFDYAPYDCAPYGYYGPDWFTGGVFLGAGPWFHGPHGFSGHVNNRFDPHHGYNGPLPSRGGTAFNGFQPNEARDGRGHTAKTTHAPTNEHTPGFSGGGRPGGGGAHSSGGGHSGGNHR